MSVSDTLRFTEAQVSTYPIDVSDLDEDEVGILLDGMPEGMTLDGEVIGWTPTYEDAGEYVVTVLANDGAAEISKTIVVVVTDVNRPPTIAPVDSVVVVQEGQTLWGR